MFYGNIDEEGRKFIFEAFERFKRMFTSVRGFDNVILFNRAMSYLDDPQFRGALLRNARSDCEKSLAMRMNTLTWAADHCLKVPGDFVECGVWHGAMSAVVADFLNFTEVPKTLYLYDT
jgi:O-methyltransferase